MSIVCQSERLSLVAPSMDHLDALTGLWSDAETMKFIGQGTAWPRDKVQARIERAIRTHAEHGMTFWTVVRSDDRTIVGQGGIVPIAFNGSEFELGYRFGREHWGRGYATETAALSRDHAFGPLGLERLVAVTDPNNAASQRVLIKTGFRETGTSDLYYNARCVTFEMLPSDLPSKL